MLHFQRKTVFLYVSYVRYICLMSYAYFFIVHILALSGVVVSVLVSHTEVGDSSLAKGTPITQL